MNAMSLREYAELDATALADLVRRGEATAVELAELACQALDRVNPHLNATAQTPPWDLVMEEARRVPTEAAFAGVPFLVKDLILRVSGLPCRQGSLLTEVQPATRNSELMERFRRAGMVTIGSTATPAFGSHVTTQSLLYGTTHNPWDLAYSPGGSSGGSAACVAAGVVPMAHANDGNGSIRVPASACHLFGLKPTRQRTPTGPDAGDLLGGRGVEFVVSRTVRDAARLLDVVHGPDPGAPSIPPSPPRTFSEAVDQSGPQLRIAFNTNSFSGERSSAECAAAVEHLAHLCAARGHRVEELQPSMDWGYFQDGLLKIVSAGAYAAVRGAAEALGIEPTPDCVDPQLWTLYRRGGEVSAFELLRAQNAMAKAQRDIGRFFADIDLLLTPVLMREPMRNDEFESVNSSIDAFWGVFSGDAYSPFSGCFNVSGQPAASIPAKINSSGLPIGVQVVAPFAREDLIFQVASEIEEAAPWQGQKPPIFAGSFDGS